MTTAQSVLVLFRKYKFKYNVAVSYICELYPEIPCINDAELYTFTFNDGSAITCDVMEKTLAEFK